MRYFSLLLLYICLSNTVLPQHIAILVQDSGVLFKEGNDSILFYQTANKSSNGSYKRSNYVHPLYGLNGHVLTEDFPADHPHHRGLFWAWHQLYVGEKRIGDGWLTKDFSWELVSVVALEQQGKEKCIESKVVWKSPHWVDSVGNKKPIVTERTTISVYPAEKNYRLIDFKISLLAEQPDTRIGGSEDKKGYGGFSLRMKSIKDLKFRNLEGSIKPNSLPIQTTGWMDMEATVSENSMSSIAVLGHPENPGYPNPWVLRAKNSMQNAVYPYPGATIIHLSNQ
ncbi:MAG: DUF6807 family protein, partial [Flavobacteriaceae bacterium]